MNDKHVVKGKEVLCIGSQINSKVGESLKLARCCCLPNEACGESVRNALFPKVNDFFSQITRSLMIPHS